MPRFLSFLGLLLALLAPASLRAQTAAEAPAEAPAEPWLETLSALLTDRYRSTGQLTLAWARPRPAAAALASDLSLIDAPAELGPQILITVRATDAVGTSRDYTLILRAELWRDGWCPRDAVRTASRLDPSAMEPRRFDALRQHDALPADPDAELDFTRNIPAGRLLTNRDVTRRPLVRRGQNLAVLATDGALTITLHAVALHDAGRGEPVRVRNPDSKKDFVAEVTGESRASVRF
jgi:flagella basal body P-ring formation protein FlgA